MVPSESKLSAYVSAFLNDNQPANTKKAYDAGVKAFFQFCESENCVSFPASAESVAAFAVHLSDKRGLKGSTIRGYVAAVGFFHTSRGATDPTNNRIVKLVIDRATKLAGPSVGKSAFTAAELSAIADNLNAAGRWSDIRDGALLFLTVRGLLRAAEIVALSWKDIVTKWLPHPNDVKRKDNQNIRAITVFIRSSKTDQIGEGRTVVIAEDWESPSLCAISWLERWQTMLHTTLDIKSQWVFPCLSNDDKWDTPLSPKTVSHRVKGLAKSIGRDYHDIGSHSGRKTGATLMVQAGVELAQLKEHGRWKSDAVHVYYKPNEAQKLAPSLALSASLGNGLQVHPMKK